MLRPRLALPLCAMLMVALLGCSDDNTTAPPTGGQAGAIVPDFSLADVNPTSATLDQDVSPRDYLQKVSAWYFGRAT